MSDGLDIEALFRSLESDRLERKAAARDLDPLRQVVAAMANDLSGSQSPGVIIVGQNDDLTCAGLTVDDPLMQRIANLAGDGAIHPFPVMAVGRRVVAGCPIIMVSVQPSANPPVRFAGRTYVRVGPTTRVASAEEERRLVEKRRSATLPYDAQGVVGTTIDDIDLVRFEIEYLRAAVAPDVLAGNNRSTVEQLRALRLIDAQGRPTATAVLVLGKDPTAWMPGAYLQARHVLGSELTDPMADQRELRGGLADQIRIVDELIDLWIERPTFVGGPIRVERPSYPAAALRQLIRNAYLHRSYEATNAPIRLTWYSNRVEILSPGGPFGLVNEANFGRPGITDYRNPTLAEAFKNLGFVERFGIGLPIARQELQKNGNPPIEFDVSTTYINTVVRSNP